MKTERVIIVVLLLILAFSSGAQWSKAQEGTPPPPDGVQIDTEVTQDAPEQQLAPDEPEAVMTLSIPVQGRATNAAGAPLNAVLNTKMTLYDASSGGTVLCTDTDAVSYVNGFFSAYMNDCVASDFDGQSAWLGITIGADPEMTPRQVIGVTPYAAALHPGAEIRGADSYVFVPGTALAPNSTNPADSDYVFIDLSGHAARVSAGTALSGQRNVRMPIILPGRAYGVYPRITAIKVYYLCENGTNSYITDTQLYKGTDADTWDILVNNTDNRTSNTAASYTLNTVTTFYTLGLDSGFVTLRLGIFFLNDQDYVQIGGVRVVMDTNY